MRRFFVAAFGVALAVATLACAQTRKSSAGFHLPNGDPQHGQQVFVELRCNACHRVQGVELPTPVADPAVPVVLGGVVYAVRTDGELAASIIDPSHRLAPGYRVTDVASGTELSRMGDYSEIMTVKELTDLVAFLQSHYDVRQRPTRYH